MPNILKLAEAQKENAQWPIDCILKDITDFDEVLIIARKKGQNSYVKFHGRLGDTLWWVGVLERVQLSMMLDSTTETD